MIDAVEKGSRTPLETYGIVANYDSGEDAYDILSGFQGPFSIHSVIARALKVAGNRLRLRMPPDSGGSFGVKQGVFPYLVLMGVAAQRHLPGFSARRCTNFRSSPRTTMSACAAPNPSRLSARRYRLH